MREDNLLCVRRRKFVVTTDLAPQSAGLSTDLFKQLHFSSPVQRVSSASGFARIRVPVRCLGGPKQNAEPGQFRIPKSAPIPPHAGYGPFGNQVAKSGWRTPDVFGRKLVFTSLVRKQTAQMLAGLLGSAVTANGGASVQTGPGAGDSSHAAGLALLGQSMASTFVTAGDGHGGSPIADQPSGQQPMLAQPHA